jgi:hypothetical protein
MGRLFQTPHQKALLNSRRKSPHSVPLDADHLFQSLSKLLKIPRMMNCTPWSARRTQSFSNGVSIGLKSDALIAAEPHGTLAQIFETFQHRQPVEAAADLAADGFLKLMEDAEE